MNTMNHGTLAKYYFTLTKAYNRKLAPGSHGNQSQYGLHIKGAQDFRKY